MRQLGGSPLASYAKVPRSGSSKTRLCPPLTPVEAALSGCFIADLAATIATVSPLQGFASGVPRLTRGWRRFSL